MKKAYYIPYIGMITYFKSFEPSGRKEGLRDCLFGMFMAFYHAAWVAVLVAFILIELFK